ncbi:hypothetical protein NFI96_018687 [Prochilodus magdalenae]|nr:hypothetical protein NFI96_018687 [Prochilodus magdalenae]
MAKVLNPAVFPNRATDAELQAVSEALYRLDSNKATASELVINPQVLIANSETSAKIDYSSQPLYKYVNEASLFSKPTFKAFIALLDNYVRNTGTAESVPSQEVQEQETFLREAMQNTNVGRELYGFLSSQGFYSSWDEFLLDLKNMWFGLYSRNNGQLDSSGFEHIFAGEIKDGKVSGFHNWVRFYQLEQQGLLNYYSHNFDGPWSSYPDVLGMQFMWDGYYKQVGSAFIGSSPEFELAIYTLCHLTRPSSLCRLTMGGQAVNIQTYTWDNSSYGDGKKYVASGYPATP